MKATTPTPTRATPTPTRATPTPTRATPTPTRANIYLDFYNSKNGFKQERKYFETYEQAVKFLQTDFDKFDLDMIHFDLI
jgi:hypothetical protein